MTRIVSLFAALLLLVVVTYKPTPTLGSPATPKETEPPGLSSGKLADRQFLVRTPKGQGFALYYGTGSLAGDSHTTRAIIIVHGVLRNADTYFATGELVLSKAQAADTLLIAPQFVEASDLQGHHGMNKVLRWGSDWPGGGAAVAPAPISTYSVFDAMIQDLADHSHFPALREIDVIGHSAGGQIVQRYAAVGIGPSNFATSGVDVRFVVANPSSYLYFDKWRPQAIAGCTDFNHWRYGLVDTPPYVTGTPAEIEERYTKRSVTYLLGTSDTNAHEWDLDTSCAAEVQGAYRFIRGTNYIEYIRKRNPQGTAQSYAFVGGIGHDNRAMFGSACGIAVIFGKNQSACARSGKI